MADIIGTEAAETLNGTATDDRIYGLGGNDKLYGKNGNDQLFGGAGNDTLNGNAGSDIAFGGSGDDTYYVDNLGDVLSEQTVAGVDDGGNDRVYSTISYTLGAFFEKLTLTGSAAVNATGNNLANVLTGNSGANVLTGGGSKDTLRGNAGADTFMFGPADATSTDKVEDFATEDWVGIRASDFGLSIGSGLVINGSGTPVLDAAYFVTVSGSSTQGTASGHGQFVYNTTTRTLMWDANGAGGAAGVALATFNSGTVLSAADFAITDGAPVVGDISIDDVTISEGDNGARIATFTVTRTGGTAAFAVNYATADGSATVADGDYDATSGVLNFGAGINSQTVSVTLNGDTTFEPNETFFVDLTNASNGGTIVDAQGLGTITNDDGAPVVGDISIDDVTISEGDNGARIATFTVTRTGGTAAFAVNYATADGSATVADGDYDATSGVLNFGAGINSQTVSVTLNGDTTFEPNETFFVDLTNASNGGTIVDAQGLGTIANDDGAPVVGDISIDDVTISEGDNGARIATFTVTRTGGTAAFAVNYATADGSATVADGDYDATSGVLNFGAGINSQTVSVTLNGDTTFEPNETFFVDLTNASNGGTIVDAQGLGTITNDDGAPVVGDISIDDVTISEGDNGARIATFTVTRTGGTAAFAVNYATADGSATVADGDYDATSGVLNFGAGINSQTVSVTLNGDTTFEPNETFFVDLTNASNGGTIVDAQGLGTIANDDGAPVVGDISIDDVTISEGDNGARIATFTVTRTGGTAAFAVNYATANGTATAGSDYVAKSGTLDFAAGQASQTVSVTLNGDTTFEPNETFFVDLTNASNGGTIVDAQGLGTITNDEPLPTVAVANGTPNPQNELGTAKISFIISLSALASEAVLVTYNTVSGSGLTGAAAGFDFTGASGTATIAANTLSTTVLVDVLGDNTHEQTENFTLQLGTAQLSPSGTALAITDNSGTGSILDNDLAPTVSVAANGIPNPQTEGTAANISFRITLSRPASQDTLVTYSTVNGTAVAGNDFTGITTATAIIAAGTTSTDVFVTLLNDTLHELSEAFTLRLDAAQLATTGTVLTITGSPGTGNITDNDPLPTVVVANGTPNPQLEGTGAQIGFLVTLSNAASQDVTLNYSTVNGTALAGSDFTGATNQTATIAAGSTSTTIFVNLINNSVLESTESFTLQLNSAQLASGTVLTINDNSGTGTIADDEAGPSVVAQYSLGPIGSTDPAGLAYIPATGTLYLSDSEVEESPFNNPINLFALETDGTLINSFNLTASVTDEPTGLAFNPVTGFMYITDDDQYKVFWVDPANPTVKVGEFVFGSSGTSDPEDIAVDPSNGNLFIVNGLQRTIVETTYTGTILNTITLPSVINDPEALAYDAVHDVFYVGVGGQNLIWKVDRNGTILDTLDFLDDYRNPVSGTKVHVKDLEFAPSSNPNDDPSKLSLYIADYGNSHVDDGRLFEVDLGNQAPLDDFLV